jgi:hypothetical protein
VQLITGRAPTREPCELHPTQSATLVVPEPGEVIAERQGEHVLLDKVCLAFAGGEVEGSNEEGSRGKGRDHPACPVSD